VSAPKEPNPTISYTVRRIRNALGHGRQTVRVAEDATRESKFVKTTISFFGVNPLDPADTFEVTLSLEQLQAFVKKFQSTIHRYISEK
jgi:HEPN pEK499 p136